MCKPANVFNLKLVTVAPWLKHLKGLDGEEGKNLVAAAGKYPGMGRTNKVDHHAAMDTPSACSSSPKESNSPAAPLGETLQAQWLLAT